VQFDPPLITGTLLKRYKRFLVDVQLENGQIVTAHVAATGAMTGCSTPGSRVGLSYHDTPGRKLPYSLELVESDGVWVLVNISRPNALVEEALREGTHLPGSAHRLAHGFAHGLPHERLRREVKYGHNSRIDLLLESGEGEQTQRCYIEVKGVTLCEQGWGYFPDAVTERGTKHLLELREMVRAGHRAVLLFLVLRPDIKGVSPAERVDLLYAQTLREVIQQGVEVMVWGLETDLTGLRVSHSLPFLPVR